MNRKSNHITVSIAIAMAVLVSQIVPSAIFAKNETKTELNRPYFSEISNRLNSAMKTTGSMEKAKDIVFREEFTKSQKKTLLDELRKQGVADKDLAKAT